MNTLMQKYAALWEPPVAELFALLGLGKPWDSMENILIVGNQKTGSTAIAYLLAHYAGIDLAPHVRPMWGDDAQRWHPHFDVAPLLRRSRYYLRARMVKENGMTPMIAQVLNRIPKARCLFTMRHPVQNIRSILDRVKLPGHEVPLDTLKIESLSWAAVVDMRFLQPQLANQIEALTFRWKSVAQLYLAQQDRIILAKYEDFVQDKLGFIADLAAQLGLEQRHDIQSLLEKPYQPKGKHRNASVGEFFSASALDHIHQQCRHEMQQLGYEPVPLC